MTSPETDVRILAIDPATRGFGFAVLESLRTLVDWGVKRARTRDRCLEAIERLIRLYRPSILVLQNTGPGDCRHRARARALILAARTRAAELGLASRSVTWAAVRIRCGGTPKANKDAVARGVAARFPELARQVPPARKPWLSEHYRMSMFDAVALATTFLLTKTDRR